MSDTLPENTVDLERQNPISPEDNAAQESEDFNPNEWITTRQATKLTGYSKKGIINAAHNGYISFVKMGNMMLYRKKQVIEYANRMKSLGSKKFTPHIHLPKEVIDKRKSVT